MSGRSESARNVASSAISRDWGPDFAGQHGQGQVAQFLRVVADAESRRQVDHAGPIEPAREDAAACSARSWREIEIDVDAAEKDGPRAFVVLIERAAACKSAAA